jgi:hypothetical protein
VCLHIIRCLGGVRVFWLSEIEGVQAAGLPFALDKPTGGVFPGDRQ